MAYKYIEPKERTYAKAYRVYSGNITSAGKSFNIKNLYPNVDYTALTKDDFICSYVSDGDTSQGWSSVPDGKDIYLYCKGLSINHSYSNGVLNVSLSNNYAADGYTYRQGSDEISWKDLKCEVVMIVDGVRSQYT